MTSYPTVADLQQLLSEAIKLRQSDKPRGSVVLPETNPILYGRLCRYAALGRSSTLTIEVFCDWEQAEQWLTAALKGDPR